MIDMDKLREALKVVIGAADIHETQLRESLNEYGMQEHFKVHRRNYIKELHSALSEVRTLKLSEELKVEEKIFDLTLEESVDMYFKLEAHIKALRGIHY